MSLGGLTPDRISPVDQSTFSDTYGGGLICCMVMLVLYGLAVLQTYMYFINYGRDGLAMKALVGFVWLMATVHAIFVCHATYHYVVLSYDNPLSLIDGDWSIYAATSVGVVLCFCIQTFFARMLYFLTKKKWRLIITSTLGILILGEVALVSSWIIDLALVPIVPFGLPSTDLSYRLFSIWLVPDLYKMVYDAMVPLFVIRVLSDTVTAVALCIVLFDSRTGFSQSLRLIKTLMIYAMERFVLTTVVVFVQTIVLITKPTSIQAMVIEFITAQLYTNSFLATLNSRNHLRDISCVVDSCHISSTGIQNNVDTRPGTSQVMKISTDNRQLGVKYGGGVRIGTETLVMTDLDAKTHTDGNYV
ncbi:hypothetical protein K435DRAFT_858679 [Dendrothele bispora CBS 962.96]|uniref:DUF6534 domain-containing protein n=1 Tax=Dendrothele bispora (strain CBS 962.96) TaxID=1314807 RepID=A0A4S8M3K0_DENBC|nr:hypothetical protein K435DRAFT_858679 [Dendrothele bispora CBS 962.96]